MISGYIAPAACDGGAYWRGGCVCWLVGGRIVVVVVMVEGELVWSVTMRVPACISHLALKVFGGARFRRFVFNTLQSGGKRGKASTGEYL